MEHQMNHQQHYIRFAIMTALSFLAMYAFMYAMVDVFGNIISNINQFYMAGLMTAPMAIFELVLMSSMYPNKKFNVGIIVLSVALLIFFWWGIRQQIGVDDEQFLKSMIPHHAGAILMCEKADIADVEIQQLCRDIIEGQQEEIDQMKAILRRLD